MCCVAPHRSRQRVCTLEDAAELRPEVAPIWCWLTAILSRTLRTREQSTRSSPTVHQRAMMASHAKHCLVKLRMREMLMKITKRSLLAAIVIVTSTREERSAKAKVQIHAHFNTKQGAFLDFVLSQYVKVGV